jgi:hypothetical protein
MAFNISEYPEKSGVLIGIPGDLDNSGVVSNNRSRLDEDAIPRWEDFTVKYYDLQSSTGIFTGHMFDYRQDRDFVHTTGNPGFPIQGFEGRGINRFWVSPTGYKYGNDSTSFTGKLFGTTGIIITYPPSVGTSQYGYRRNHPEYVGYDSNGLNSQGTGIFNFVGFLNNFSNADGSRPRGDAGGIYNWYTFGDYVHWEESYPGEVTTFSFVGNGGSTTEVVDEYDTRKRIKFGDYYLDEEFHDSTDPEYKAGFGGT